MTDTTQLHGDTIIVMDNQSSDVTTPHAWSKGLFLTSGQQEEMVAAILPVYDPALLVRRESKDFCIQQKVPILGRVCQATTTSTVFSLLGVMLLVLGALAYTYS